DLRVDACATGERQIVTLEVERAGALAHDEAVAALVERTACVLRVVVACAHRTDHRERAEAHRSERRLDSARQGCVRSAAPDEPPRFADADRTGGTRHRVCRIWSCDTEVDRDR